MNPHLISGENGIQYEYEYDLIQDPHIVKTRHEGPGPDYASKEKLVP